MNKYFFSRNADIVAKELLGKILVRNINGKEKIARIVETEAYFDNKDPASRACQNGDLKETMEMKAGTVLVYGVHNNWMLNFVTGKDGEAQAVLIRAIEPVNFNEKCKGPGLLTKALKIDKRFHKQHIINNERIVVKNKNLGRFKIGRSFRIGVKKDLDKPLRFYIKDNEFVSRV